MFTDSHKPSDSCEPALKRIMEQGEMELDIIINPKTTDDGQAVVQV